MELVSNFQTQSEIPAPMTSKHSANIPLANLIPMHISAYDENDYDSPIDSQQLMAGEEIHALLAAHGV